MLSVIIPTLNAGQTLGRTLHSVQASAPPLLDVLVVDGGSSDDTARIAADQGAKLIETQPGRGRQLAHGAEVAKGPWLLFLHADTVLPDDWEADLSRFITLERNQNLAGYFRLRFDIQSRAARRVAALANWRADVLGLPYGDQGLLIHRDLYEAVGGFRAEQNLMEDVDLVRRIGPMRLKRINRTVTTSATRYQSGGWWARPTRNVLCLALYLLGAPPRWIESLYR
ncbi:TIGR04283 family arsenosugar biosynthesis glycosyltransferase [Magnetovibrio sp.]|uniref:TIGR04283 family arsenosugar biosynthesis glycosyltransferase n=1 Tax=Magnetovibrio sp. TaxID=2024836 RepID=UPI002F95EBF8